MTFTKAFYKHILGIPLTFDDYESFDPDIYSSFKWYLENDLSKEEYKEYISM